MKVCSNCKVERDNSVFISLSTGKETKTCEPCRDSAKKWKKNNKSNVKKYQHDYDSRRYKEQKYHMLENNRKWRIKNPDYMRTYLKKYHKVWRKNKRLTDPCFKIENNLRCRR